MSQDEVKIVKEFTRCFAAGGRVTDDYFDPEIVWDNEQALEAAGLSE